MIPSLMLFLYHAASLSVQEAKNGAKNGWIIGEGKTKANLALLPPTSSHSRLRE